MTHGWPGSVIELLDVIGPLTDPPAHGGNAGDAFDLVLPSLPGYGYSSQPTEIGWDAGRIASAWTELMHRLGYDRWVAQGGDVGASVTDAMGRQAPDGLLGIHVNLLLSALLGLSPRPVDSESERAALDAINTFSTTGNGYFIEQATRPQTIGYALLDSPVAPGGLDARPRHRQLREDLPRLRRRPAHRQPHPRPESSTTSASYWLTGTGASAAREYWDSGRALAAAAAEPPPDVSVPVAFTTFPGEIFAAPRSWVEQAYPTLAYFNEVDKGGHFAAWEEPELFATEIRAAFRPLR